MQQAASFWQTAAAAVEVAVEAEAAWEGSAVAVALLGLASLSAQTYTDAAKECRGDGT